MTSWVLFIYMYSAVAFREPQLRTAGNGGPTIDHIKFNTLKDCKRVGKIIRKTFSDSPHVRVLQTKCIKGEKKK